MNPNESCQLKVLDRIYYVNFEEIKLKIKKGTVLRQDQIKVGNTAWTVIEYIPEFTSAFQEFEAKNKLPENFDTTHVFTNFQVPEMNYNPSEEAAHEIGKCCALHGEIPPFYICTVCENLFCKDCPVFENELKFCPFCGGKCVLYLGQTWRLEPKKESEYDIKVTKKEDKVVEKPKAEFIYTKLQTNDFICALTYPLKYPHGLLVGGFLFALLAFGQIVTIFQGGMILSATMILTGLFVMLKFGILSRCFENFQQTTVKTGFMPRIKKFAVFEDFINPLFLGLKSYCIAFGLFFILAGSVGSYAWLSFEKDLDKMENEMFTAGTKINSMLDAELQANGIRENKLRKMVNQARISQLEAVFGSNHLVDNRELEKAVMSISRLTVYSKMPVFFTFILGVLFFPAVCLTINRNHSLSLTKLLICSLKEIKIIGFDYIKIMFICLILLVVSIGLVFGLNILFSYLNLPVAGILSAMIVGNFLIFYFWTVFASILAITNSYRNEYLPVGKEINS